MGLTKSKSGSSNFPNKETNTYSRLTKPRSRLPMPETLELEFNLRMTSTQSLDLKTAIFFQLVLLTRSQLLLRTKLNQRVKLTPPLVMPLIQSPPLVTRLQLQLMPPLIQPLETPPMLIPPLLLTPMQLKLQLPMIPPLPQHLLTPLLIKPPPLQQLLTPQLTRPLLKKRSQEKSNQEDN